jgi:signal transduction histidine kinase
MSKLRRRFIIFNIIIIGAITVIIAAFVNFGNTSQIPVGRLISIMAIMLVLVFIGSVLSSKIAMKPIQSSWQRQLEFTADASHELRTPLAVIQTNLELVLDNPNETVDSQSKWLGNIHIETIRMTKLVDDLLTLSRGDTGENTLEYSVFSLNSVAGETAVLFETAAEQKGIDIQVVANDEIQFCADISRIKQLFGILVDNAIKYMDKPGQIQIVLSRKDNTVQITVSDSGKGIAPEHLEKIFSRFYRVEKQATDGFGLGLSIAKWIVKEHGGSIRAESIVGEGTRFIVCFPGTQGEY